MSAKEDKGIFKSNILRTVIFCILIIIVVAVCALTFTFRDSERSNTVLEEYYAQEENTVDCVFFGSSATYRSWIVPRAYENYGLASYSLSTGTQPFVLTEYLMKESLKTQDVKLFVIELRAICKNPEDIVDVAVRRVVDNMKLSKNKFDAINAVLEYADGKGNLDDTGLSYYFPLLKYHSLWNPSKQPNYIQADYYQGYAVEDGVSFRVNPVTPLEYNKKTKPIARNEEDVLNSLLDYCDSIDAQVLFLISPYQASEQGMGKINYARNIVEKRGYKVMNCLPAEVMDEIGLNVNTCFYDQAHLNYHGATLYTDFMADYIMKNYGLEDRRGDKKYSNWDKSYDKLMKDLDGCYKNCYQEMMEKVEAGEE